MVMYLTVTQGKRVQSPSFNPSCPIRITAITSDLHSEDGGSTPSSGTNHFKSLVIIINNLYEYKNY
jgi:hypothetical protein